MKRSWWLRLDGVFAFLVEWVFRSGEARFVGVCVLRLLRFVVDMDDMSLSWVGCVCLCVGELRVLCGRARAGGRRQCTRSPTRRGGAAAQAERAQICAAPAVGILGPMSGRACAESAARRRGGGRGPWRRRSVSDEPVGV